MKRGSSLQEFDRADCGTPCVPQNAKCDLLHPPGGIQGLSGQGARLSRRNGAGPAAVTAVLLL